MTTTLKPLPLLMIVAIFIMAVVVICRPVPMKIPQVSFAQEAVVIHAPDLQSVEWGLTDFSTYPSAYADPGGDSLKSFNPQNVNLPQPPEDVCKVIKTLTGKPCRWQVRAGKQNGNPVVQIKLISGKQVLGEGQMGQIKLSEYPELGTNTFQGSETGWISHIRVANWLQNQGFGKLVWKALDVVTRAYATQKLGEQTVVHIFIDASSQGWGESLLAGIDSKVKIAERLWLYVIN